MPMSSHRNRKDRRSSPLGAAAPVIAARAAIRPGFVEVHESSMWLRQRLAEVINSWPAGCTHVANGRVTVFPLVAPLWAGAISCNPCAIKAIPADGSIPSGRCDRCGAGIGPDDVVHMDSVLIKTLLVVFGLCPNCHRREGALPGEERH